MAHFTAETAAYTLRKPLRSRMFAKEKKLFEKQVNLAKTRIGENREQTILSGYVGAERYPVLEVLLSSPNST